MKKRTHIILKQYLSILFLSCITFISCTKDNGSNNPTPAPTPTPANGSFTWTENNNSTIITADSAFYRAAFKTIFAYKKISGVMKLQYEINLTAGTPATYPIGTSNVLTYTSNTPFFVASAGNIIITVNSGTKVSGTFQGSGTAVAGITSVAGAFTDIPVQ